jgi:hypothetical protein
LVRPVISAGGWGTRLLLNANDGKIDAAMTCMAIRAHDAARIQQNLCDTNNLFATTNSATILDR